MSLSISRNGENVLAYSNKTGATKQSMTRPNTRIYHTNSFRIISPLHASTHAENRAFCNSADQKSGQFRAVGAVTTPAVVSVWSCGQASVSLVSLARFRSSALPARRRPCAATEASRAAFEIQRTYWQSTGQREPAGAALGGRRPPETAADAAVAQRCSCRPQSSQVELQRGRNIGCDGKPCTCYCD